MADDPAFSPVKKRSPIQAQIGVAGRRRNALTDGDSTGCGCSGRWFSPVKKTIITVGLG